MKPSVTQLIGLLDKPGLLKWANKIGLQGIKLDEYRNKVMQQGTNYHKQIENYIKYNTPFLDNEFFNNYENFFSDKIIIESESKIETDYFTGRLDIKFKYNNRLYLCDFKSNHKDNYLENKLQLCAYRMATNCDCIAIISLPDMKLFHVNIENYYPYEQILINLSKIFTLKQEIL